MLHYSKYCWTRKKKTSQYGSVYRGGQKRTIQILHYNSTLRYAIALNFGRNTTSVAPNPNWYNSTSINNQCLLETRIYTMLIN